MIILIKNNKGGVGKSFITAQLGKGLSFIDKKTLIITSDSQNNVLEMLYDTTEDIKKGLIRSIRDNTAYTIKIDENLDYIPLEKQLFFKDFDEKFKKFIKEIELNYDYILIDSTPTLKLDNTFLEVSDKIFIPVLLDKVSITGANNLLNEVDINKILGFIINKYQNKIIQNKYLKELENDLGDNVFISNPIKNSSYVEQLVDDRKSIWESSSIKSKEIQETFTQIIELILSQRS